MGIFTPAARLLHKCHENVTICLLKQVVPDQARNQEGQSQRRSQGGCWRGSSTPLSDQNIDVYFL